MKTNRILGLLLGVAVLPGCVVAARPAYYAPRPPVVVTHVHSPDCGHFYGYYSGYPVYFYENSYSYWDGGVWIRMAAPPPVVVYRNRYYGYYPRGHYYGRGGAYYAPPAAPAPAYNNGYRGHGNGHGGTHAAEPLHR